MENKKFLVIDGNSIMNRAYYGLMRLNMTSSVLNIHTNALYAFLNIYWMILDKYTPDYVVVSFDLKAPTFRHKMYAEYKGTRHGMPDELKEQMPVIKEILKAMNVPIIEKEGYEADDILGTIAKKNEENNIFTYILTGDRDSYQLISNLTSVIMPSNKPGKTEYTEYTPELLNEKYGITPRQVIEVKALMGDSSDNIPGVKGVGEKTAYSLIQKYDNIENIYSNIDSIDVTPKVKEKLLNDKEMAYLSHTLATIDINAPIEINYEKSVLGDINKEEVYKLFKDLEFKKFMDKYDFSDIKESDVIVEKKASIDVDVNNTIILNNENISLNMDVLEQMFLNDKMSYMFNINSKYISSNIKLNNKEFIALYNETSNNIYILDLKNIDSNFLQEILSKFATSNSLKLGFNIKQDILYLFTNICNDIKGFNYDLMIAYYLLNSNISSYPIAKILDELFDIEFIYEENKKEDKQLSLFDIEEVQDTFLTDTDISNIAKYLKGIYYSYDVVIEKLKEVDMLELFNDIEMPLTETLACMEKNGMYIDKDKLNEFDNQITSSLNTLEIKIHELAQDKEFNINSTQQLGVILFEKLGLPVIKKTKTGYSTDKDVLEK